MEQLNIFDPAQFNSTELNRRCGNPSCPVGTYEAEWVVDAFGAHVYCIPCLATYKHGMPEVLRSIKSRESGHAARTGSWPGYTGSTVLEFRMYLGPEEQWDNPKIAGWVTDAVGSPCEGCKDPYVIRGDQPHIIKDMSEAHVDVVDPEAPPGMSNLQILCTTCNTSKKRMSYAQWRRRQHLFRMHAHAEVAARKVA